MSDFDFKSFPTLITPRLILRQSVLDDAADFFGYLSDLEMDKFASVRLMQKLGFHHEGVRRECIRSEDGSYQSWGLFGLLENEYYLEKNT
jgi:hypothetical protein